MCAICKSHNAAHKCRQCRRLQTAGARLTYRFKLSLCHPSTPKFTAALSLEKKKNHGFNYLGITRRETPGELFGSCGSEFLERTDKILWKTLTSYANEQRESVLCREAFSFSPKKVFPLHPRGKRNQNFVKAILCQRGTSLKHQVSILFPFS